MMVFVVVLGNVVVLKYLDIIVGCVELIEEMFIYGGLLVLQNFAITYEDTEKVISWPQV